MARPPTLAALSLLLVSLSACHDGAPPAGGPAATVAAVTPAPPPAPTAPGPVAAPATPPPAPSGAPARPAPEPPGGWPGLGSPLQGLPTLYVARVVAPEAALLRKPKHPSETTVPLRAGHLVEVLSELGPDIAAPEGLVATLPARVAGFTGWVRRDAVRRLEGPARLDFTVAWAELRAALGAAAPPEGCRLAGLLADVAAPAGEELVVHAPTTGDCGKAIGVFAGGTGGGALLGWLATDEVSELRARPYAGRPAFLELTTFRVRTATDTGSTLTLYRADSAQPGPLVAVFTAVRDRIDATTPPVRYELSAFGTPDPEGTGRWLLQWRHTERIVRGPEREEDRAEERFFRFDGERFVPAAAPVGVAALPPPPPSFERISR